MSKNLRRIGWFIVVGLFPLTSLASQAFPQTSKALDAGSEPSQSGIVWLGGPGEPKREEERRAPTSPKTGQLKVVVDATH